MKLRTKLLLGYAGFVLALGLLGGWSARTLSQMSAVSARIIAENYDSVVAAQDMKESLERLDSAALFDLLGQRDRARRQAAENRERFDAAVATASADITVSRAIVGPVAELTAARTRVASGDLDTPAVAIRSADEIGALAVSFNRMADRLRELRRSDMGKLVVAQQTTEAVIDSLFDPV